MHGPINIKYETSLTGNEHDINKLMHHSPPPFSFSSPLSSFLHPPPPTLPLLSLVHMCSCIPLNKKMFCSLIQSWTRLKILCRTGNSKETGRRGAQETITRAGCSHCCSIVRNIRVVSCLLVDCIPHLFYVQTPVQMTICIGLFFHTNSHVVFICQGMFTVMFSCSWHPLFLGCIVCILLRHLLRT